MPQRVLDRILDQIRTLDANELAQVSQAVQEQLTPQQQAHQRQAFYRALRASGLVRQIKTRSLMGKRWLAQVQGDPVSRTIIEERR